MRRVKIEIYQKMLTYRGQSEIWLDIGNNFFSKVGCREESNILRRTGFATCNCMLLKCLEKKQWMVGQP